MGWGNLEYSSQYQLMGPTLMGNNIVVATSSERAGKREREREGHWGNDLNFAELYT